jgi:hypothetical protein
MKIREYFKRVREKFRAAMKEMFGHSIYEAAEFNGLAIEYWEHMPAHYDGHLDTTNEKPRFIAVNPDLPKEDQVYVIAREIGHYAQRRRIDSPFMDRPWRWNLLATAPTETRNLILKVDLEVRAHWIMYWHAGRGFSGFYKRHRKKSLIGSYYRAISDYIFWKLRIRNFIYARLSPFRFVKACRLSLSFSPQS